MLTHTHTHTHTRAAEGLSHFIRRFNYRNNLEASVSVINQAVLSKSVKCIVFTSSIASFGAPPKEWLPMIEETPQHPEDPYGVSKLAVELDLKAAKEMFDMDFVVFRPHNVFGPKQNIADKFRNGEWLGSRPSEPYRDQRIPPPPTSSPQLSFSDWYLHEPDHAR